MEILIKILAFILLGIGAFTVYGARIIDSWVNKNKSNVDNNNAENNVENLSKSTEDDFLTDSNDTNIEEINIKTEIDSERKIVNIKITGILIAIAGVILVLVTFR